MYNFFVDEQNWINKYMYTWFLSKLIEIWIFFEKHIDFDFIVMIARLYDFGLEEL